MFFEVLQLMITSLPEYKSGLLVFSKKVWKSCISDGTDDGSVDELSSVSDKMFLFPSCSFWDVCSVILSLIISDSIDSNSLIVASVSAVVVSNGEDSLSNARLD